jgi:predicted AlkP superfamily phosphohydrolase/phosphomutase
VPDAPAAAPSVWFVGLDALDPDLLREAVAAGRCPTLAGLMDRGSVARTTNPAGVYVGAIWPSFATATGCARHGRACFEQLLPGGYASAPFGAAQLRGEPFWRRANAAGRRVAVVDVPKSHFTGDVVGAHVVDWGTHDPEAPGFCASPPSLAETIRSRVGMPPWTHCDQVRRTAAEVARLRDDLATRARRREGVLAEAIEEARPDLVAVAFPESHCAGHQLWHLHDPRHPRHDAAIRRELGDPLLSVYEAIDESVGHVLATAPKDAFVLVLASHGMGPHYDGVACLDEALERLEPSLPQGRPPSFAGRLARFLDRDATRGWSRRLRRKIGRGLPLPPRAAGRTCFLVPNNDAWAGVRVNLVGREPHGRIRPGAEEAAFLSALEDGLREMRNGETGGPVFGRMIRTADAHPGPHAAPMPDLMAEWLRDAPILSLASPRIGRGEGRAHGFRSGDHKEDGLAIVVGPGIAPGVLGRPVPIECLAPTLLARLGVDWPGVDGRPVPEWTAAPVVV